MFLQPIFGKMKIAVMVIYNNSIRLGAGAKLTN